MIILALEAREVKKLLKIGVEGEPKQKPPPWKWMKRGSFSFGFWVLGMNMRTETPVSGEITTSFEMTPVWGSS